MEAMQNIPEAYYPPLELRTDRLKAVIEHDKEYGLRRPPVPGEALDYIFIPAMGFMTGRLIKKGQVIRIIDLEGQQVADVIMWDADNFDNVLNGAYTQFLNKKWNYWRPGDTLFSMNCDKLATITDDTTNGIHAFCSFCSERVNYVRFGIPGTINCRDNFVAAMAGYGLSARDLDSGSCLSCFMNVFYHPDGSTGVAAARSKPGDYVDLMAERDIVVPISNCPSIRSPTNNHNPTSLMAVIFNPGREYQAKAGALPKPDVLTA